MTNSHSSDIITINKIQYLITLKEGIMKRIAEKVVLIALICITFIFALTTILYVSNAIEPQKVSDNSVAVILLAVLAVVYVGLAAYLVYVNFSERLNVKRIMLFYDAESSTRASSRVVDNIVNGCAKQVSNIKVRKTKLRVDEKLGLIATVHVEVAAEDVTDAIPKLRGLLVNSFANTLGLKFNSINFEVDKLTQKFIPETKVESQAKDVVTEHAEEQVTVETEVISEQKTANTTAEKITVETVEYEDITEK